MKEAKPFKPSRKVYETPLLQPPNYYAKQLELPWRAPHPQLNPSSPFLLPPLGAEPSAVEPYTLRASMVPHVNASQWSSGWKPLHSVKPTPVLSTRKHWSEDGRSSAGLFTTWPDLSVTTRTLGEPKTRKPQKEISWQTYTMASMR